MTSQLRGKIFPGKLQISQRVKAIAIGDDLKKTDVYCHLRRVRADKRLKGRREKKARETAEEGIGTKTR